MHEQPDLPLSVISAAVKRAYGLDVSQVVFLPLGYDPHTAVYRVETQDGQAYFLKLRKGNFAPVTVLLPQFLNSQGIQSIIAPLVTLSGTLFTQLANFAIILYPFVPGRDGYEVRLSDMHWIKLGETLQQVHAAHIPPALARLIPSETFDPQWRESAAHFLRHVETEVYTDPVARQFATFMQEKREVISHMLQRAEELAVSLNSQPLEFVLCHSDAHPGNYLIAQSGGLYLVDWDNPIYALKERDLMCIGSGMSGNQPGGREESLFYQGYGASVINHQAMAYYRYERIIQDMAEFCKQILMVTSEGEDRAQSYTYFVSSFLPGAEVDVAVQSDQLAPKPG